MSFSPTAPLIYIECDVPEGMTLADWGHRNAVPRQPSSRHGFTRWGRPRLRRDR